MNRLIQNVRNTYRWTAVLILLAGPTSVQSQQVQDARLLPQHDMARWNVPGANYSGIANLRPGGRAGEDIPFALVSDKETKRGFYTLLICQDPTDGDVTNIIPAPIQGVPFLPDQARDAEGIAFVPQQGTLYISYEDRQHILPFDLNGRQRGTHVSIPTQADHTKRYTNYGFEGLTYDVRNRLLWTCTEQSLKADAEQSTPNHPAACLIRLMAFDDKGTLHRQIAYRTDTPKARRAARTYAFGVSALTALEDGSLLVLEREFFVAKNYVGSWVQHKIYRIDPSRGRDLKFATPLSMASHEMFVRKELITEFKSKLNLTSRSLANYEAMCLGPILPDGRQTLLLVSDSQGNHGNKLFHMQDCLRIITFRQYFNTMP